jgi:aspartate aminotransferase-like enzyme
VLYPGKLTQVETFRVGCIGAIGPSEMRHAVNAIRDALAELGIKQVAPIAVGRRRAEQGPATPKAERLATRET